MSHACRRRARADRAGRPHPCRPPAGHRYGAAVRFFYDTEFIEDGVTIDLVSIGVVDETGRSFYAVSTEFDPGKAGKWVREHVLDKLPKPADPAWRSRQRIRDDLLEF